MDDQERILGQLLEHRSQSNERLDRIEAKIDGLLAFRWKLAGVCGFLSLIGSAVVEVIVFKHWG